MSDIWRKEPLPGPIKGTSNCPYAVVPEAAVNLLLELFSTHICALVLCDRNTGDHHILTNSTEPETMLELGRTLISNDRRKKKMTVNELLEYEWERRRREIVIQGKEKEENDEEGSP